MSGAIVSRISDLCAEQKIKVDAKADFFLVSDLNTNIVQLLEERGFCPIVSQNKVGGKVAFTVTPYSQPLLFLSDRFEIKRIPADPVTESNSDRANLFSYEDLTKLFKKAVLTPVGQSKDNWAGLNMHRSLVTHTFNQTLTEVVTQYTQDSPILEIGSGAGYRLSDKLSSKLIRTQADVDDYYTLKRSESDHKPIYNLDVRDIYKLCCNSGKKIPLFFALNVFDAMADEIRSDCFSQIAQLQSSGGRLLILSDTNPEYQHTIRRLEAQNPGAVAIPYLSLCGECTKLSAVLVPKKLNPYPSDLGFLSIGNSEMNSIFSLGKSMFQDKIHDVVEKLNLQVIALNDYNTNQVKSELEKNGYECRVYYHTTFTVGDCLSGEMERFTAPVNFTEPKSFTKYDLVYKQGSDIAAIRTCCLPSEKFSAWLATKKLSLPKGVDKAFLKELRRNRLKLFGAEVLVIEATKK